MYKRNQSLPDSWITQVVVLSPRQRCSLKTWLLVNVPPLVACASLGMTNQISLVAECAHKRMGKITSQNANRDGTNRPPKELVSAGNFWTMHSNGAAPHVASTTTTLLRLAGTLAKDLIGSPSPIQGSSVESQIAMVFSFGRSLTTIGLQPKNKDPHVFGGADRSYTRTHVAMKVMFWVLGSQNPGFWEPWAWEVSWAGALHLFVRQHVSRMGSHCNMCLLVGQIVFSP